MKTSYRLRNSFSRWTPPAVFVLLCATALVPSQAAFPKPAACPTCPDDGGGAVAAQSAAAQDPEQKMPFSDEDLKEKKVDGRYKFSAMPDSKQAYDPTALAAINRVNMSHGRGKYAGLAKVASVGVENRSRHALKSLRLKWRMVSVENPQEALLEGGTPPFEVSISPQSSKVVETPHVFFNRIVKPLLKNNELHGNYHLLIRVSDVLFEDGSARQ